ncbi:RIO1 family regulatory kinase/ATPase [Idiomarina xiamenensis]|uniref:non-specific serine/threonine protein kinase n=1 Tax=Idiomarina xiamenensis 10-D-4 TaxID=740709 RepID=K2KHC7_9GAMM|nr:RIO1 family regulatory kinase/ATPase [Idiomarina xiamenensis]EKE82069.1 serine/threonine protein kinase [Idiomarina xiamenensis 10-D-4]
MATTTLLQQLNSQFPQHQFSAENLTVVHKGRFANAIVFRYHDEQFDLIIKDFQHSPWWVRRSFARLSVNQEYKGLSRLAGVSGVAARFCRLSPVALAYDYIDGESLRTLVNQQASLPKAFFSELERMVSAMHRRGVVHLDLRNLGNILCSADGKPYIIDFQSSMSYARFPKWLQRFMRRSDISGVYKAWSKLSEQSLPPSKETYLKRFNHVRKRWIFRGYPMQRAYTWATGIIAQGLHSDFLRNIFERFL